MSVMPCPSAGIVAVNTAPSTQAKIPASHLSIPSPPGPSPRRITPSANGILWSAGPVWSSGNLVADALRAPAHAFAAIDRQRDAGDEARLVGVQEQRGVGHVPAGAHPPAQGDAAVTGGDDLFAARALRHPGLDGHGR